MDLFIKSFKMYCSHISNHISDLNIYLLNGTVFYLIFLKFIYITNFLKAEIKNQLIRWVI
jgi:uncharacterized membrane protein